LTTARDIVESVLQEAITASQRKKIENAKPNDKINVYHGTRPVHLASMMNGFDATKIQYRDYGGPKHAGLFISLDPDEALKFAGYGEVVLEIEVRAKQIHGTDYSGNIGRKQTKSGRMDPATLKWVSDTYPNSFRPYMAMTMLQSHEPQGLLVGLVSPRQIKRIRWAPYKKGSPRWMTRREFMKLGVVTQQGQYDPKKPIVDVGIDLSTTRTTVAQLFKAVTKWTGSKRVADVFRIPIEKGNTDKVKDLLSQFDFGVKAQDALVRKLQVHFAR
jgi:hypothetical protein